METSFQWRGWTLNLPTAAISKAFSDIHDAQTALLQQQKSNTQMEIDGAKDEQDDEQTSSTEVLDKLVSAYYDALQTIDSLIQTIDPNAATGSQVASVQSLKIQEKTQNLQTLKHYLEFHKTRAMITRFESLIQDVKKNLEALGTGNVRSKKSGKSKGKGKPFKKEEGVKLFDLIIKVFISLYSIYCESLIFYKIIELGGIERWFASYADGCPTFPSR
jgi:hypothetical protein